MREKKRKKSREKIYFLFYRIGLYKVPLWMISGEDVSGRNSGLVFKSEDLPYFLNLPLDSELLEGWSAAAIVSNE